jgi:riboflavin biosynthesis pyrimidine reductase
MHEAVLVGIGTVMADNPQLNIRHVTHYGNQPRPIVLDTQFRILTSARLLENNGKRTMPWIYVHPDSLISDEARQKQKVKTQLA